MYDAFYELPGALTRADIDTLGRRATRTPNDDVQVSDWFVRPVLQGYGFTLSTPYRSRDYRYRSTNWASYSDTGIFNPDLKYVYENDVTTLTLGMDYQHSKTKAHDATSGSKIKREDFGFYAHDVFRYKYLELEAGIRNHRAGYDFGSETARHNKTVWNVGAAVYFDELSKYLSLGKVFANYGTSFRFPATDEYWSVWSGLTPELKPQTSETFELGIEMTLDPAHAKLVYFTIETKQELYYDPYNYVNANLATTDRQGLELFVDADLPYIKPWASFSWMWTDIDNTDNQIPMVPDKKITIGTDVEILKDNIMDELTFFTKWNYIGTRHFLNDINNSSDPLKSYNTTDIGIRGMYKNILVTLGIDNLFDAKYSDLGVRATDSRTWADANFYYPNQGRTFYVKGKVVF